MKSWQEFTHENPELSRVGKRLLFQTRPQVGYAFLATLRKDGAPRLHPISLVLSDEHLYVLVPPSSPKCADLKRDGRFALQAFPPPMNVLNEEFYLSGQAVVVADMTRREALTGDAAIQAEESEVLFEMFLERAMYTRLVNPGKMDEHPLHQKWRAGG